MFPTSVFCGLLILSCAASDNPSKTDDPPTSSLLQSELTKTKDQLQESWEGIDAKWLTDTLGVGRALEHLENMEEILETAQREIPVQPSVQRAIEQMNRSDYAGAWKTLEQRDSSAEVDPLAAFCRGICAAEQGNYSQAADAFRQAHASAKPTARTALLLAEFCERLRAFETPAPDRMLVEAFDQAYHATSRMLGLQTEATLFMSPPLMLDPLLLVLTDAAATASIADESCFDATMKWNLSPLERYLIQRPHYPNNELAHAAMEPDELDGWRDGVDLLCDYFGKGDRYRESPKAVASAMDKLAQSHPSEGLWWLLSIPHDDGWDEAKLRATPLAKEHLDRLERALAAPTLSSPFHLWRDAMERQLSALSVPHSLDMLRPEYAMMGFVREIHKRLRSLTLAAVDAGDTTLARRALRAQERLTRYIERSHNTTRLERLVLSGHYGLLIESTLAISDIPPQRLNATFRRYAELLQENEQTSANFGHSSWHFVPLPSVSHAFGALLDDHGPWARTRARRSALGEIDDLVEKLNRANDCKNRRVRASTFLEATIVNGPQIIGAMNNVCLDALDDKTLYAFIWAVGELGARDLRPKLEALADDRRPWVRLAVEEALAQLD